MGTPLRVLIVEDSEEDAKLILRQLRMGSYEVESERVCTDDTMRAAIDRHEWDIILSDYRMPGFSGMDALRIVKENGLDIPFILVSGTIGEDIAVDAIRSGASDYLLKDRLGRLLPAVERAILECRNDNERRQTEEALRISKHHLDVIVNASGDPIFVKDKDSIFILVNDALCNMLGLDRKDIIGKTLVESLPKDQMDHFLEVDRKVLGSGKEDVSEELLTGRDGITLNIVTKKTSYVDERGAHYLVGVIHDITGRVKAESEQRSLEGQLRQSEKMETVGRLAGGVAHDFNNMLGVILGHAEIALGKVGPAQPGHANLMEIWNAGQRSAELTRQLLTYAAKQAVEPKILDMNATVEGLLKMLRRLIGEDINLAWLPGSDVGAVKMDPTQFDQILTNLCVNARDAIKEVGKISIETRKVAFDGVYCGSHAGVNPGEYSVLMVGDNGCGMDKQILEHIFEPFFTSKEVGRGTGLGLATVEGIVRQNGGFIEVASEPDKGTTFRIFLPFHEAKISEEVEIGDEKRVLGQGESILLVEDEQAIRELTESILNDYGYRVLTAGAPSEAIQMLKSSPCAVQLLITDVVMPGMNGRNLAGQLTALCPGLKVLYMSGYTADVIATRGVLDEGVNFIQKPFKINDLAVKVRMALDTPAKPGTEIQGHSP